MAKEDDAPKSELVLEPEGVVTPKAKEEPKLDDHQPPDGDASKKTAPEEQTLEAILKEEPIVSYKKVQYPATTDDDIVKADVGYEIRSEHTLKDIDKLFGENPNPKLFFSIMKNDPKGANLIARASGWKSADYAKAAIESLLSAKTDEERQVVLEEEFPEWTWKETAEKPFQINIQKEGKSKIEMQSKSKLPWDSKQMTRAINDFVAENDIKKDSIVKSAKVAKLLEEFSVLRINGEVISADKALEMAINQAGIKNEPLSKDKKVSIGGNRGTRSTGNTPMVTDEMKSLLRQMGKDPNTYFKS